MDYEGLIDDNCVLIACSMNYETAVTFTSCHFNKVVFAVYNTVMTSFGNSNQKENIYYRIYNKHYLSVKMG